MKFDLFRCVSLFLVFILSLPIHEFSHAYMAKILGDDSAQKKGRFTINPMSHVDLLGLIFLMFFNCGWARPVPVNVNNFSKPKRDMVLVSLAGPISNLMLSLIGLLLCKVILVLSYLKVHYLLNILGFFKCFIDINISLAVFNLIPIPPLDGSRILMCFFSDRSYYVTLFLERFGGMLILVMVWSRLFNIFMAICSTYIFKFFDFLTSNFGFFDEILFGVIGSGSVV